MPSCNKCYEIVEKKIGNGFSKYGRFVARHPWKIIAFGILLNGLLGIGMIRLNILIDVQRVYTPIGSQASKNSDEIRAIFPDLSGSNFVGYQMPDLGKQVEVIVRPKRGDILDTTFLSNLKDLFQFLFSITAEDEHGKTISLTDICAHSFGNCSVDGDIFIDNQFLAAVTASTVGFPFFQHSLRGDVYIEQLVGGAKVSSGILQSASMLIVRANLRTDSDYYVNSAKLWQDKFLEHILDYSNNDFDIVFSHADSLSEELNENITGDIALFSVTFTIMITYACLATFTKRCDVVGQRSNLGFAGVLAAGLAIVAAFGVGSACGVEFVSIVGVVPFLIIGIGVDDMFLLISGITSTNFEDDVETRIGETMRTSGVSITITSLTDCLAFAAGASSIFLSVRNFCIYAGIAVVFCYINQATIFISCIAINENRMDGNRHFATCMKLPDKGTTSTCAALCCSGSKPKTRKEAESLLDKVPRLTVPKIIRPFPAKIIILVLFAVYLGVSIWGITRMKEGLDLKTLVAESSYYYNYREWLDNNFPVSTSVSFVFDQTMIYSSQTTQVQIKNFLDNVKAEDTIVPSSEINWLESYKLSPFYTNNTETGFISGLQTFLSLGSSAIFKNDVVIDSNSIVASRVHLISTSIQDSQEQGQFMLRMRELASESTLSVFAFSPAFLFYEQYVSILSQTLQTLGIAVGMIFFVTVIFMPHPLLLVYVTTTVMMITVGIFGFLPFLGLTLSAITMIHIIMSIGFSVDFAAHICHGYMISEGETRDERMKMGLIRSGAPIFHGAVSSIIGVIMLAAAKSFIFFSFFQVMSLVITFGILHALFLLPVVLSFIGPAVSNTEANAKRSTEQSTTSFSLNYRKGSKTS